MDEASPPAESAVYRLNEGTLPLAVPGDWEDQTIHVLRQPGHGHATPSLVVTRETLPLGITPEQFVRSEIQRLAKTLPEFVVRDTVTLLIAGQRCQAVMTRWRAKEGLMDQISCCIGCGGRRALIFTATCPSPMADAEHQTLLGIIAGFKPHSTDRTAG